MVRLLQRKGFAYGAFFLAFLGLFCVLPTPLRAAASPQALIQADDTVRIDKNIIYDASGSFLPPNAKKVSYRWDFGDGTKSTGVEAVHDYKKPGKYQVNLELQVDGAVSSAHQEVFVYRTFVLMLTDMNAQQNQIENLPQFAENEGVYLKILEAFQSASPFIAEELLAKKTGENLESLRQADEILLWTQADVGINALNRFVQTIQSSGTHDYENKVVLVVRDQLDKTPFSTPLKALNPRQVFLAKEASIYPFLQSKPDEVAARFQSGGYEFRLIDASTQKLYPWNFLSYLLNYLIANGVSESALLLLLMLPIVALIVVFMRQVVGLTTYGLYIPLILTMSLVVLGLKFGLLTFLLAVSVSTFVRYVLKNSKMLYIPKLGIVVTAVVLALLAMITLAVSFHAFDTQFFSIAIFPMLIMGTLAEKFTNVQNLESFKSALIVTFETVGTAVLAYIIVGGEVDLVFVTLRWDFFINLLRLYPEIIFVALFFMVLLGKWTGLRIVEYIRFREILNAQEE